MVDRQKPRIEAPVRADVSRPEIAVIVPCYNEAEAITTVVHDLRAAVPEAVVYVYDNASTDGTAERALAAGAVVRHESRKGKGNVLRRALGDIDADLYVIIDGDDTYDAAALPAMIERSLGGPFDQVTGVRRPSDQGCFRAGHEFGNRSFNLAVSRIFGEPVNDMLSGYRVLSRRFVRSFPAASRAFEIETELTIHAVNNRMPQSEIEVGFKNRPEGSESKLNTYRDGLRILRTIVQLLFHERPMAVWSAMAAVLMLAAGATGATVVWDYLLTGRVDRLPSAVLASGLVIFALGLLTIGVVLDGQRKIRREQTRVAYLNYPATIDRRQHSVAPVRIASAVRQRRLRDARPAVADESISA